MKKTKQPSATARYEDQSQIGLIIYRFKKNKMAIAGLFILLIIAILVIAAPLYTDYSKGVIQNIPNRFKSPNAENIFGTDSYGRDLFTRVIYGGRISLFAGIGTVLLSLIIGCTLGGIAGFFGGKVDMIIMRFVDIFMAVPPLLLSLAVCTALGQGTFKMIIALTVADVPRFARILRASVLTVRDREFVEAARCCGTSNFRIIIKHILPNCIGPVVVQATLMVGSAILSIAALGFLGIGVASPTPEWGTILSDNRQFIRFYPYLGLIPGFAIGITVMCVNFFGDGLRDALDPKMKK